MDIKLTDATAAEWAKRPIEYDTGYNLLPGTYQIKVLARDSETGRIGTFLGTVDIPNLNKEHQRLPITSVVLSSQRVAMKDALATAGKSKKAAATQAANPLVQDGQKLIPNVTRVFSSRGEMYVYLQAYEPGATITQPLVAYVSFLKGPLKMMETPLVKVSEGLDPISHMLPVQLNFSLSKLRPGEYDCEVTLLDPAGQKAAFGRRQLWYFLSAIELDRTHDATGKGFLVRSPLKARSPHNRSCKLARSRTQFYRRIACWEPASLVREQSRSVYRHPAQLELIMPVTDRWYAMAP